MVIWQRGDTLDTTERETILQCLRYYKSNKTLVSKALGVSVKTIRAKIMRYEHEGHIRPWEHNFHLRDRRMISRKELDNVVKIKDSSNVNNNL
jgi:hypothetical protein